MIMFQYVFGLFWARGLQVCFWGALGMPRGSEFELILCVDFQMTTEYDKAQIILLFKVSPELIFANPNFTISGVI